MAEPALKVATDFMRLAVADFDMSWDRSVDVALAEIDPNLADLHNALSDCEVKGSNKLEAEGVFLNVVGSTTEEVTLIIRVWVNPDRQCIHVESVFRRESGDDKTMPIANSRNE